MFLPIQWVFAMILAGAIHEFCHIAVIYLLNETVYALRVGARGAVIETAQMPPRKELLCAIAGPVGSALLLLTVRWFPRLAICGAVHCIYNLLPLFPFDGGRVLHSIIYLACSPVRSERIWKHTQMLLRFAIVGICVYLAIKFGWMILLCGFFLFRGVREEKLLANRPVWRYNSSNIDKGARI